MAGTLLRLPKGTQLNPNLLNSVEALLGPVESEYYDAQQDPKRNYERRRDSLFSAFIFIVKAYPPNSSAVSPHIKYLQEYAEKYKYECVFDKCTNINNMQNVLAQFTAHLVNALIDCWEWPKNTAKEEAIACLNEAEQYVLMQQPRKNIATLVPMQFGGETHFVLQSESVLPPGTDQWYDELESIKKLESPRSPNWFYLLQKAEQIYLTKLPEEICTANALKKNIKKMIDIWASLKNTRMSVLSEELTNIVKGDTLPKWFTELSECHKTLLTGNMTNTSISDIESKLNVFYNLIDQQEKQAIEQHIHHLKRLPLWYSTLSITQQSFLGYILKNTGDIPLRSAITWLSSRHRTLPALANARRHNLTIFDASGNIIQRFAERYASSHIVSRDVLTLGDAVIQNHMRNNFQQLCHLAKEDQLIIIQTLISPVQVLNYMPASISEHLPPDLALYNQLIQMIKEYKGDNKIIQTNHPLNMVKYISYTSSSGTNDCNELLKLAKNTRLQTESLQALTIAYEQALNSKLGSATILDYRGRELFLSSLEQLLIIQLGGLSYGSCVSGKDRKAIEFMHTDAMLLYFYKYGKWHIFTDPAEERNNFINIVVELFTCFHQQEHAGQNAPGSEGIKTPANYWPTDIAAAITKRLDDPQALKKEDRYASNNEVAKIGLDSKIVPGIAKCKLAAKAIGTQKCQEIIDVLYKLTEERERFKRPAGWVPKMFDCSNQEPTGIQQIRNLVQKTNKNEQLNQQNIDPIDIVGDIFSAISSRPEKDGDRTDYTISIYKFIRTLYTHPEISCKITGDMNNLHEKSMKINTENRCPVI